MLVALLNATLVTFGVLVARYNNARTKEAVANGDSLLLAIRAKLVMKENAKRFAKKIRTVQVVRVAVLVSVLDARVFALLALQSAAEHK